MLSTLVAQLPWVIVWVVVLVLQDRYIKNKNWFGSLILIWVSLILSFVWDFVAGIFGWTMDYSSRFWILFVLTAILHVVGRRREKKAIQQEVKEAYAQPAEAEPAEQPVDAEPVDVVEAEEPVGVESEDAAPAEETPEKPEE